MSTKLAHQTQKAVGIGNGLRTGVVDSVSSAGVMVNINGAVVGPFAYLNDAPVAGDTVSIFRQDSSWLVMGRATPADGQWVPITLMNSFTNGSAITPSVRKIGNNLQVYAWITSGASTGSGTAWGSIPGSFAPANSHQPVLPGDNLSSGVWSWSALAYNSTTGLCEFQQHGTWANGNQLLYNGLYPLDL